MLEEGAALKMPLSAASKCVVPQVIRAPVVEPAVASMGRAVPAVPTGGAALKMPLFAVALMLEEVAVLKTPLSAVEKCVVPQVIRAPVVKPVAAQMGRAVPAVPVEGAALKIPLFAASKCVVPQVIRAPVAEPAAAQMGRAVPAVPTGGAALIRISPFAAKVVAAAQ